MGPGICRSDGDLLQFRKTKPIVPMGSKAKEHRGPIQQIRGKGKAPAGEVSKSKVKFGTPTRAVNGDGEGNAPVGGGEGANLTNSAGDISRPKVVKLAFSQPKNE